MGTISRYILWVAYAAVSVPAAAIFGQLAVNQFDHDPWFLVSWGQSILGNQGFWVACVLSFGLGLGVLLMRLAQEMDRGRYKHLIDDIRALDSEISQGLPLTDDRTFALLGRASSIERQLEQAGIATFTASPDTNRPTLVTKANMVFKQIEHALRVGDKRSASKIVNEFNALEAPND